MIMKVVVASAVVFLRLSAPAPLANALEYLEPTVQRHAGVIPRSVCKHLIELGEKGVSVVQFHSSLYLDNNGLTLVPNF